MTENNQLQQVREATWDIVDAFRETNRILADDLVALQDRNLRFVQDTIIRGAKLLTDQTETTQRLQQRWRQQSQRRREALPRLTSASMRIYMNFFLMPFPLARQLSNMTEEVGCWTMDTAAARAQREREQAQQQV